jgi:hypothetical protein
MDHTLSVRQIHLIDTFECRALRQLDLDSVDLRRIQDEAGVQRGSAGPLELDRRPLSHTT